MSFKKLITDITMVCALVVSYVLVLTAGKALELF
jgi:hypothetical protein